MKNIYLYLFCFLSFILTSNAQVQIGSGTDKNQKLPIYPGFGYSYSQSIYLANEINASGTITSIQWYYSGVTKLPNAQKFKIYIGKTNKSTFGNSSDWVNINQMTLVYDGSFPLTTTTGWKTFTLSTPFEYDGTSNLVIAANDNQEASDSFDDRFYNTAVNGIRSLAYWNDAAIDISNPPSAYSDYGGFVAYVPNIILGGITQTCPNASGLNASNIDTTSATIKWTASNPAPALGTEYYYSTSDTDPNSSTLPLGNVTSGVTANLVGLAPGTKYYVWIRNKCSTTDYSSWSNFITFTTDCEGVDYISQNFDQVTPNDLPPCWSKIIKGPGSGGASIATYESEYAVSFPNLVELFVGTAPKTSDILLVSPRISNLGEGKNRLKFYAKGSALTVTVGTLDKNDITGVFTPYQTVTINYLWKPFEVDFKDYRGTDKYIAFKVYYDNGDTNFNFADIDNFLWETNPACPDVTKIIVPETTPNSATVNWDSIGNVEKYEVAFGNSTVTDPNTLTPLPETTNTTQSLIDLSPNTTYKVWVRSICNGGNFGAWNEPVVFTTPCLPEPEQGFYEDFNEVTIPNLPNCWSKIISGPTATPFSTVDTTEESDILPTPNKAVKLYNFETFSDDYKVILVSPKLSTLQLGTYRLKFIAKITGYDAALEIGTLNNNTNFATFTPIQTNNITLETTEYTVDFTGYTGSDTFIGIRLKPSQQYCSVIIDNIKWEIVPACPDVTNIAVTDPTINGATVSWTGSGSEESYDVSTSLASNTDPNLGVIENTTSETITVTNLINSTNYKVWVRSVCSPEEKGSWIGPVSFTTACEQIADFVETFEDETIPYLPACWSKIVRGYALGNSNIVTTETAQLPNYTKAVEMRNTSTRTQDDVILVTPNLSTLSNGNYRLKFKGKGYEDSILEFGTLSNNTYSSTFNKIQGSDLVISSTPTQYTVEFNGSYGNDSYIGIRLATNDGGFVELDNIIWEPIPNCPDTSNLKFLESDTDSAIISWNADQGIKWQVAVGAITDSAPSEPYTTTSIPYFEIPNLNPGTSYQVWVRTVCDINSEYGAWEGPITVTTQCEATGVTYKQDFETAVLPNLPNCTTAFNMSDGPYNWYVSNNPGYGFNSNTLTYDSDLYTDANAWFFTQGITLEKNENYTLSFRYGGASNDTFYYNNSLKVKYGNQATELAMTLPLFDNPFFGTDTPISESVNFIAPESGIYYFGFDVYSPNNSNFMYIDDILIEKALGTSKFNENKITHYPNPVKDIFNISSINNITAVNVYNILGQEVIAKSINSNLAKIDMSTLANGTYLVKVTADNLVKTIKVNKQ